MHVRVLRKVRALDRAATRHIGQDPRAGEPVFYTFYVGRLKSVCKVWRFAAVDGASPLHSTCVGVHPD